MRQILRLNDTVIDRKGLFYTVIAVEGESCTLTRPLGDVIELYRAIDPDEFEIYYPAPLEDLPVFYTCADIQIWDFETAPEVLKNLSIHGGDEDWIAIVKDGVNINFLRGLDDGDIHKFLFNGCYVLIKAH